MPYPYEYVALLIVKYLRDELSENEKDSLESWLEEHPENRAFLQGMRDENLLEKKLRALYAMKSDRLWEITQKKLADRKLIKRTVRFDTKRWIPYAAALLIGGMVCFWQLRPHAPEQLAADEQIVNDIRPAGNRATLELANGRSIVLDQGREEIVVSKDGVTYGDGDFLEVPNDIVFGNEEVFTLQTPLGGTYKIILADGSQVWLNAGSILKYPKEFGLEKRQVELVGEGYFVVTPDAHRPFTVRSAEQEVTVLGTEFNISAYTNQKELVTTLIEGSVEVIDAHQQSYALRPGEQAVFDGKTMRVTSVDVNYYTSWKIGRFIFNREPLQEVLKQLTRWYDVEFVSQVDLRSIELWGTLSRDIMLSELLDVLEINTGLTFKRKGRRVMINK